MAQRLIFMFATVITFHTQRKRDMDYTLPEASSVRKAWSVQRQRCFQIVFCVLHRVISNYTPT